MHLGVWVLSEIDLDLQIVRPRIEYIMPSLLIADTENDIFIRVILGNLSPTTH